MPRGALESMGEPPAAKGDTRGAVWHDRLRWAAYASAALSLVWTVLIILPFPPFSYLPPIMVGGGAGTWFVLAYVLFFMVGVGGFGILSVFLHTIEVHENRSINSQTMWPALVLLFVGFVGSCVLLAVAGYQGGYASMYEVTSDTSIHSLLAPYVDPTSIMVLIAVVGAALALLSMVRARWPSP